MQPFPHQYHWSEDSEFKVQSALNIQDVRNNIKTFLTDDEKEYMDILVNEFNQVIYQAANLSLKKEEI